MLFDTTIKLERRSCLTFNWEKRIKGMSITLEDGGFCPVPLSRRELRRVGM